MTPRQATKFFSGSLVVGVRRLSPRPRCSPLLQCSRSDEEEMQFYTPKGKEDLPTGPELRVRLRIEEIFKPPLPKHAEESVIRELLEAHLVRA